MFSPLAVGYNIGVLNSPAEFMKSWCNDTLIARYDVHLTVDQLQTLWASIISIFLVGGCIGSICGASFADKLGRKGSLLSCGMLFAVSAVLFYLCRFLGSVEVLIVARLIVGLSSGMTTSILPMYLAEIAPLELRGTIAVLVSLGNSRDSRDPKFMSSRHRFPCSSRCDWRRCRGPSDYVAGNLRHSECLAFSIERLSTARHCMFHFLSMVPGESKVFVHHGP